MIRLGILSLAHPHSRGNHIPALKYMRERFPVTAIYHDDAAFAAPWVEMFGAKYYDSRDALLADREIDAVLITSTNDRHAVDCIAAAKAGKAIFCDKPVAVSVDDGARIVAAVKQYGVPFLTTFPVRFSDAVLRTKKMIGEGKLGRILAITATNHGSMYEPCAPEWVLDPKRNGGGEPQLAPIAAERAAARAAQDAQHGRIRVHPDRKARQKPRLPRKSRKKSLHSSYKALFVIHKQRRRRRLQQRFELSG